MEWISRIEPECFCPAKIRDFTESVKYGVGSQIRCDCGRVYVFIENETGSQWWDEK